LKFRYESAELHCREFTRDAALPAPAEKPAEKPAGKTAKKDKAE
jgi:hypothetical protein